ncbi:MULTISPECIES: integrase family protein [unclassified Bradyrhizobium]|uniref:tyrosine-type recombinase/integrase n=2 Tax=Bradyrhizobium TaxID=374 RepID=UPI002916E4AA|nr:MULTISPECIES: integrase family protein [unclassified Bradyrhizobium]
MPADPNKVELTDLMLRQLAKTARDQKRPRYAIWDARQEHLALRVAPTGRLVWNFVYRHHGEPRWHKFGSFPNIGVADARKRCRKLVVQVDEGGDPQADRMAQRKQGTVEELIPDYVEDRKNGPHGKAWKQTERLLLNHVQPHWGKLRPGEIRDADMQSLLRRHAGKPAMQNAVRNAASAFLTWTKGGSKLNKLKPRERNLSEAELAAWWTKFEQAGTPGKALQVLLLTGQRPIEVARMRTEHLDQDGWWEQPGHPEKETNWPGVKNKRDHRVFISEAARSIISGMGTEGFVFRGPSGVGPVRSLDKTMREISKQLAASGIEPARPHDLRRSFATIAASLGFSTELINRIQNHMPTDVGSVHYNKYDFGREKAQAMEAVAARVLAVVEGRASNVVRPTRFSKARQ